MLRQLLNSLAVKHMSATDVAPPPVARVADKLDRRQRQMAIEHGHPKSVCSSLRDLCEM